MAMAGQDVLTGSSDVIEAFDAGSGETLWRVDLEGQEVRGLALADGHLLAANHSGALLCFSPEAVAQTSCAPCNADAGCVAYLATGDLHEEVRLEVYPTDGLALTLAELTPDWSGPARIEQVWLGRPLAKIWAADGSAGGDGNVGSQAAGVVLNVDDATIPSSAVQRDGLPMMLRFDRDQRLQTLGLTFATETGVCEATERTIDEGAFFDDFDDGKRKGWTVISGSWSAASGELYQSYNYGIGMILAPNEYTDFAYEVKIKIVKGYNPYLVFRYQDNSNYYTWGIKTSTNEARFAKYHSGSFIVTGQTSYYCTNRRWYLLRVEVCGSTMRGYIDCQQVLEVTDTAIVPTGLPEASCNAAVPSSASNTSPSLVRKPYSCVAALPEVNVLMISACARSRSFSATYSSAFLPMTSSLLSNLHMRRKASLTSITLPKSSVTAIPSPIDLMIASSFSALERISSCI